MSNSLEPKERWYQGISRYEWLVLIIASAGWIFDVYEGQIFNLTRNNMLGDILGQEPGSDEVKQYGEWFLAVFLLGGTFGGILFGSLADKYGRRSIMIWTILMYSVFSGLTYFASELWHVTVLRFLVAMGVGGEWAVAAALVSEVFPKKARAHASSIFHASSVCGTWLAAIAAIAVGTNWKYAYLVGVLPALLIIWVRVSLKEPEKWKEARKEANEGKAKQGSLGELFSAPWGGRAIGAMLMAAVGLGTFWAVTVAGQDLAREQLISEGVPQEEASQKAKFAYGIIQTIGGGLGLILFGPISSRLGRKKTFILFHIAALIITPITCFAPTNYSMLLAILPIFGFFTLGMHAGYAVYFPELFPSRLRATGTSVGFNGGRLIAALTILLLSGYMKKTMELPVAMTWLAGFFLLGVVVILFLPETKDQDLLE